MLYCCKLMHKGANHEKEKNILGTNIDIVVDNVSI
jgi:hypothetical protein